MIDPSSAPSPPVSQPSFVDLDRLENAEGIVAIISQRSRDGALTFAIHREWISDGVKRRGAFFPERLTDAYQDMVRIVIDRMKQLREAGDLPFPVRSRRAA